MTWGGTLPTERSTVEDTEYDISTYEIDTDVYGWVCRHCGDELGGYVTEDEAQEAGDEHLDDCPDAPDAERHA
jgi:hypothetical protein